LKEGLIVLQIDFKNVVTVGLIAFIAVFVFNRALSHFGYSNWKA